MIDLPPQPSGWLNPAPAVSRWLDGPVAVATTSPTSDTPDTTPPPFARRPITPALQAPSPEPPPGPPPTAPQTTPPSRWYWTTQGWLWGYQDASGFVHPTERKS